jgi:hypothetical protein
MKNKKESDPKKGDLNFKKWLLSLSSIGNLILGGLLFIMGISAMRFHLDKIFVADRGLIIIGLIIIISSILCFIGIAINNFILLLTVFYLYILTMVFLSIFALGAITMNPNLIDWIDNHWDIIRNSVFSYDMNKFKMHVTTEINSLGIFSLTLNAIILVSLICISNFLKFKNIIFALSPLTNLIFSALSFGLIIIGFYSYQHAYYTSIPTWSCTLVIVLGFLFLIIGIFGYISFKKIKRNWMIIHLFSLGFCVIMSIVACIGIFNIANIVTDNLNKNWGEISKKLYENGYTIRKSYMINQIHINLKLTGFYIIVFIIFSFISLLASLYQYHNINMFYQKL